MLAGLQPKSPVGIGFARKLSCPRAAPTRRIPSGHGRICSRRSFDGAAPPCPTRPLPLRLFAPNPALKHSTSPYSPILTLCCLGSFSASSKSICWIRAVHREPSPSAPVVCTCSLVAAPCVSGAHTLAHTEATPPTSLSTFSYLGSVAFCHVLPTSRKRQFLSLPHSAPPRTTKLL